MSNIDISVVIPVYNAEDTLKRCVDSILNQVGVRLQLILIDDESPDNSGKLCDEFALSYENVVVIHKKNGGPGVARSEGLNYVKGRFVAFVDADDYIDQGMYRDLLNAANDKNADCCICGYRKRYEDGFIAEQPCPLKDGTFQGKEVVTQILYNIMGGLPEWPVDHILDVSVWKAIYSMDVIRENSISFYSDRVYYSEDTLFNIDFFLKAKKVVTLEKCYYNYMEVSTSYTKTYNKEMHEKNMKLHEIVKEKLAACNISDEGLLRFNRIFLGYVRYYLQRIVELYSFHEARKMIIEIVGDQRLIHALEDYPYKRNPIKQKLIHNMIHRRNSLGIWLFIKMKSRFMDNRQ